MAPQRTAGATAASSDGPARRTPAATQQQQRAAADLALPLLLQHDSIRTQLPVVCKLLCCSKALAAAVAEHSARQLDMPVRFATDAKAEQAAAWLRKHARLVRSLDLRLPKRSGQGALDACVAALMAAGPQSLALQSLAVDATDTTLPLLEQLLASRLTRLELSEQSQHMDKFWFSEEDRPVFVARVSAALGRLMALRSLELFRSECAVPLSGLSTLTQLTALSFYGPLADLQHVPPQLLELRLIGSDGGQQEQPLDLRHLAAATALNILHVQVREGDVLPPNLLMLQVDYCWSVQPLLPLAQLQQLELKLREGEDITADQLRQLSRLTSLSLDYGFQRIAPASAGAWPALALQQLKLQCCIMAAPVCQHLAQLSGLTSLALQWFELPQAGSAQQLAAALRQLSGLQRLGLWASHQGATADASERDERAAGLAQLAQAVGGLQQLCELDSGGFEQLAAAAGANSSSLTALAALTALNGLSL